MAGRVHRRGHRRHGRVNDMPGGQRTLDFFRSSPSIPVASGDTTTETIRADRVSDNDPIINPASGESKTRSSTTNVNAGRVHRRGRGRVNDMSGQRTLDSFFRSSPSIPVASGDTTTETIRADRVSDNDPIINPASGESKTRSSTTNVNAEGVVKVEPQASLEAAEKQAQQEVYKKKCDEYCMKIACLAALKSKISTPVGACIVDNESKIVGVGYNSIPSVQGEDSDEACKKNKDENEIICASINAVKNKTRDALDGCTIYITLHPDNNSVARAIQAARIKEVVYWMFPKKEGGKMKELEEIGIFFKANKIETREMTMSNENGVAKMLHNRMRKSKALEQVERPEQQEQGLEQHRPEKIKSEQHGLEPQRLALQGLEPQGLAQLDVSNGPHGTIAWDEFFMGIAKLSSQAPITIRQYDKQPKKAVGACIVSPNNEVRAIGYSGYPKNMTHDDTSQKKDQRGFIIHAECKAIMGLSHDFTENCTLYVTSYPCHDCAKLIVLYKIKQVVFDKDKGDSHARNTLQNVLTRECVFDEGEFYNKLWFIITLIEFRKCLSSDLEKLSFKST